MVVVLGRYVPQFSFLHVILGDEAVLVPEARFYQRLLAMDDHEARATTGVHAPNLPVQVFRVGQAMVKYQYPNVGGQRSEETAAPRTIDERITTPTAVSSGQ